MMDTSTLNVRALEIVPQPKRLVIYGSPGVGKTWFSAGASRPLFIDTDGGLVSVAITGTKALVVEPKGHQDLEAIYFWCKEHMDDFDSIVIDSLTELQQLLLGEIIEAGEDKGRRDSMMPVPEQRDNYAVQRQLHRTLHELRRLGKHIIVTAGLRDRKGQNAPDVTPGLLSVISHWSQLIGELVAIDNADGTAVERYLVLDPSEKRVAKNRYGLPRAIKNPTWDMLNTLIDDAVEGGAASKGTPSVVTETAVQATAGS